MIFAELPNVTSLTGVVYAHGFYTHVRGTVVQPGRFPGHIKYVLGLKVYFAFFKKKEFTLLSLADLQYHLLELVFLYVSFSGVYHHGDFTYLDGDFGSEPGMSGGPITMGDRVIGVNVTIVGGSRRVVSPLTVYMTLMAWCGFDVRDPDPISFVCTPYIGCF